MTDQATDEPSTQTLALSSGPITVSFAGEGPPVLVLHHDVGPFGWTPFLRELSQSFTVFAADIPGFGESQRAEWARHPRDLAAIMLNTARALGLRHYGLVGLGFGGWVAAEMASFAHPEMVAMVLVGPAGIRPDEGFILDQVLEEHVAYLRAGFNRSECFDEFVPDPRDKGLRERLDRARESVARVSWKPYMYSYELPETLAGIDLPVTVVWGDADAVVPPSAAQQYRAVLPQCQLRTVPGAGHFVDLEAPGELAAIVKTAFAPLKED